MPTDYGNQAVQDGFNASAPPPLCSTHDTLAHRGGAGAGAVELKRVLPATPDINFKDHFTNGLIPPTAKAACPLSTCGQLVEESQLVAHTLRCSGAAPLLRSKVHRYLVAEGHAAEWPLVRLLHLTDAAYEKLLAAAAQWHAVIKQGAMRQGMHVHVVKHEDTLPGLAIYYGTTAQAIRMANRLSNEYIHQHATLLIPTTQEFTDTVEKVPTKSEVRCLAQCETVAAMQRRVKCDQDEAVVLLSMCDFSLEKALAEHQAQSAVAPTPSTCLIETNEPDRSTNACCTLL